eukprot:5982557-Lingulodinium_polyedra.AAC.1
MLARREYDADEAAARPPKLPSPRARVGAPHLMLPPVVSDQRLPPCRGAAGGRNASARRRARCGRGGP